MIADATCLACGQPLSDKVLSGLCPACMQRIALAEPSLAGDTAPEHRAAKARGADWEPSPVGQISTMLPHGVYSVESFIGRGGMGAVYKGTQLRLKRPVAIKVMRQDRMVDAGFQERFLREAHMLARLNHPGIVSVFDCGEAAPGLLYIVMEFVEGADLLNIIRDRGLSEEHALQIVPQICDALQFAHDHGIVHRDIKPSNILVTHDGRVKVADFGLARPLDPDACQATQAGVGIGTPDYAAPEQFMPDVAVDHRADIYALGVVIYEMITSRLPRGAWLPPSQATTASPAWDGIIARALEVNPADRYSSATELKTDIVKVSPGSNLKPPSLTGTRTSEERRDRPMRPARRQIRGTLIGTAIAAAIWGGVAATIRKRAGRLQTPAALAARPELQARPSGKVTASKAAPFINSLGMKFVPVPVTGIPDRGKQTLLCIWETRVRDYEVFAQETKRALKPSYFEQGADHPVVNVSGLDAAAFCEWLTNREREAGLIDAEARYRLPTDHEWSCAVGIGDKEDPGVLPWVKSRQIDSVFPWGSQWPPPEGVGNFYGEEATNVPKELGGRVRQETIPGLRDMFPKTAPVGRFPPNALGIHDLGGNVSEFTEIGTVHSPHDRGAQAWLRGGSWGNPDRMNHLSSFRLAYGPDVFGVSIGFRVALETP